MKNMDKFEEIYVNVPKVYDELYKILYPEKFRYENEIVRHRIKHIDQRYNYHKYCRYKSVGVDPFHPVHGTIEL